MFSPLGSPLGSPLSREQGREQGFEAAFHQKKGGQKKGGPSLFSKLGKDIPSLVATLGGKAENSTEHSLTEHSLDSHLFESVVLGGEEDSIKAELVERGEDSETLKDEEQAVNRYLQNHGYVFGRFAQGGGVHGLTHEFRNDPSKTAALKQASIVIAEALELENIERKKKGEKKIELSEIKDLSLNVSKPYLSIILNNDDKVEILLDDSFEKFRKLKEIITEGSPSRLDFRGEVCVLCKVVQGDLMGKVAGIEKSSRIETLNNKIKEASGDDKKELIKKLIQTIVEHRKLKKKELYPLDAEELEQFLEKIQKKQETFKKLTEEFLKNCEEWLEKGFPGYKGTPEEKEILCILKAVLQAKGFKKGNSIGAEDFLKKFKERVQSIDYLFVLLRHINSKQVKEEETANAQTIREKNELEWFKSFLEEGEVGYNPLLGFLAAPLSWVAHKVSSIVYGALNKMKGRSELTSSLLTQTPEEALYGILAVGLDRERPHRTGNFDISHLEPLEQYMTKVEEEGNYENYLPIILAYLVNLAGETSFSSQHFYGLYQEAEKKLQSQGEIEDSFFEGSDNGKSEMPSSPFSELSPEEMKERLSFLEKRKKELKNMEKSSKRLPGILGVDELLSILRIDLSEIPESEKTLKKVPEKISEKASEELALIEKEIGRLLEEKMGEKPIPVLDVKKEREVEIKWLKERLEKEILELEKAPRNIEELKKRIEELKKRIMELKSKLLQEEEQGKALQKDVEKDHKKEVTALEKQRKQEEAEEAAALEKQRKQEEAALKEYDCKKKQLMKEGLFSEKEAEKVLESEKQIKKKRDNLREELAKLDSTEEDKERARELEKEIVIQNKLLRGEFITKAIERNIERNIDKKKLLESGLFSEEEAEEVLQAKERFEKEVEELREKVNKEEAEQPELDLQEGKLKSFITETINLKKDRQEMTASHFLDGDENNSL